MKRILVVTESLRINETSSGVCSSTFIAALAQQKDFKIDCLYNKVFDYEVTWLPEAVQLIKLPEVDIKTGFLDSIPKVRALSTLTTGIPVKYRERIKRWELGIQAIVNANRYDLIITLGSGSEFFAHHGMLSVETKIPWLANFHDPYPLSVYPEPYQKKSTYVYRKLEAYAQQMFDKAQYVSFPSQLLKELMQQRYDFEDAKSLILPHVAVGLNHLPSADLDEEIDIDASKFTLLHAGTLLGPRRVEQLFEAFNQFVSKDKERQEKAQLFVLGSIAKEHQTIQKLLKNYESNIVVFDKRVSYKKSLALLQKSTIGLVIEADAAISPFMPGKLADLIGNEKPILALTPAKSETLRILGASYPYKSAVNATNDILHCLENMWQLWQENKLNLPRKNELKQYLSATELNRQIVNLF